MVCSLALIVGCFGGKSARNDVTITGTVTVDGQPIPNGSITFMPADGQGQDGGGTIKDGKYTAKASVGEKFVTIDGFKVEGQRVADPGVDDRMIDNIVSIVPEKYRNKNELRATVKASGNTFDFKLESEPKK